MHPFSKLLQFFTIGFVASAGFFVGSCFQNSSKADRLPYREIESFSKVLHFISNNFVDEVDMKSLVEGSIQGMLQKLDPHSVFLTPKMYQEFKEDTSGRFGGLGLEVTKRNENLIVIAPIEDGPSYIAGIKERDIIISVDGKSTVDMPLDSAVSLMRGKPGTAVNIGVLREVDGKKKKMFNYKIKRQIIKLKSVKWTLIDQNIAYLKITSFTEKTYSEFTKAFKKLEAQAKDGLKGIVLDLRGNPGGLLDQAVGISNFFIEEGPIVYTIGRDKDKREIEYAQKGRQKSKLPLVTLIDSSSASASEIVAGALQDYGRSIIAGRKSFGKGSVQTIIPMGNDSGLKLTIARYYTPSGRSIQAEGIVPDVELEYFSPQEIEKAKQRGARVQEKDLVGHIEKKSGKDKIKEEQQLLTSLQKAVRKDYMVTRAKGILKTMNVVKFGKKKPKFAIKSKDKKTQ